jgi:protein gp37
MSKESSIEWTEATWNPLTGCTKISPACQNCYAERLAARLKAMGNPSYTNGFDITLHERLLQTPLAWLKPKMIFVNSMSDLFHEAVSEEFIIRVFNIMNQAYWHNFQVLTKRSDRLLKLNEKLHWSSNIWMGVSVENSDYIFRIDDLRQTQAKIKFISFEPLLGPIHNLDLEGIDWVIVGGESGPRSRPIQEAWVIEIKDKCIENGIPFFFKQWGGRNKKKAGKILEGKIWNEFPDVCNCNRSTTRLKLI